MESPYDMEANGPLPWISRLTSPPLSSSTLPLKEINGLFSLTGSPKFACLANVYTVPLSSVSIAGAFQFQESFTVVQDDKGCFAKVLLLIIRVVEMDSTDGRSFSVEAAFICCMCPVIAVPAVNGISGGERGITAAAVDF